MVSGISTNALTYYDRNMMTETALWSQSFTLFFLFMLVLSFALQWWLNRIQTRHVARHRHRVPEDFADYIRLEDHQKAAQYTITKLCFSRYELVFSSILLLFWTLGGGLQWLDEWLRAYILDENIRGVTVILSFGLISALLDLPFSIYRTFVIEQRFGFNQMSASLFISDMLKSLLLTLLLGVPLIYVILWIMQSSASLWWLYAWMIWLGFGLLMMWAYPAFIAPLFNRFTPLEDEQLKQRIEKLMQRCGFISSGIEVMDGSRRTSHGNAYFTGLGKNKKIVFYDNLLKNLNADEVEAVLAHELGHFRKKHILKRIGMMAIMSLGGFALLGYLLQQNWFFQGLGVAMPSHYMALILFSLSLPVFLFPLSPLTSFMSRKHEFEADAFAAEQTDANWLINALVKLYQDNYSTLTPSPVYSAWYDSHPPAMIRLQQLRQLKH